ncbi:P-loop containing nucleoside triphosphate hydrolase [Abortiporus biennis]
MGCEPRKASFIYLSNLTMAYRISSISIPSPRTTINQSRNSSRKTADDDIVIAVMGVTGTGKSTFINLVSGGNLATEAGLISCTNQVTCSRTFEIGGKNVTLVDTPGFDDSTLSDTDVLKMIALHLSMIYEQGFKLSGLIYMHCITDFKIGGISR